MEVLIYLYCLVLLISYILMGVASIKIYKELKVVLNTPTDDLDLPTTL
jgi:hypothetical protein